MKLLSLKTSIRKRVMFGCLVVGTAILLLIIWLSPRPIDELLARLQPSDPGWHRVLAVHDGDTIDVDFLGKTEIIRFIGVDTPETHHPSRPVQCFGAEATSFTHELLDEKQVRLEADEQGSNRDRYDRLLRYVYLPDGTLLNAKLIEEGYGFAYLSFNFSKLYAFETLETQARRAHRGLWGACDIEQKGGYINTVPAV